jgi:DNA-directed RNA polymerase specialized sigma24 family protein
MGSMTARQVIAEAVVIALAARDETKAAGLAETLRLWEWGRWSRKDGGDLGYPPCLLRFVAKGWPEKDLRRFVPDMKDEEAMRIDTAIASLPFEHRKVLITIYKYGVESRKLSEVLSWSRHRIEQLHNQALGMLSVLLNDRINTL